MRTALAVVVGVFIGVAGVFVARSLLGPGSPLPSPVPVPSLSPLPSPMCEALVKLSVQGKRIVAEPDRVCLALDRSLTWDIADRGEVTIDFKTKDLPQGPVKGPFVLDNNNNPFNTARGVYSNAASPVPGRVGSNKADQRGLWKYTVKWKLPTGEELEPLDPAVCIRD